VQVRLFGTLKGKAPKLDDSGYVGIVELPIGDIGTINDILKILKVDEMETSHIFLNHEYTELSSSVKDGDKVGIFPRDMALLYRWYLKGGMKRSYATGEKARK
jgi:molybdopterin converting factor small subunit